MLDSLVSLDFRLFGKQVEKRSKNRHGEESCFIVTIIILCVLLTAYFTPDCGCLCHRPDRCMNDAVRLWRPFTQNAQPGSNDLAALVLMNPVHVLRRPCDDVMTSERREPSQLDLIYSSCGKFAVIIYWRVQQVVSEHTRSILRIILIAVLCHVIECKQCQVTLPSTQGLCPIVKSLFAPSKCYLYVVRAYWCRQIPNSSSHGCWHQVTEPGACWTVRLVIWCAFCYQTATLKYRVRSGIMAGCGVCLDSCVVVVVTQIKTNISRFDPHLQCCFNVYTTRCLSIGA